MIEDGNTFQLADEVHDTSLGLLAFDGRQSAKVALRWVERYLIHDLISPTVDVGICVLDLPLEEILVESLDLQLLVLIQTEKVSLQVLLPLCVQTVTRV